MGLVVDTSLFVAAERRRFDLPRFLDTEAAGTPIFVAAISASELLHGVHRAKGKRAQDREQFVEEILRAVVVLPFDLSCARLHAELWAKLEAGGNRIGPHDLQIAATCLAFGHEIATLNRGEFERVQDLRLAETLPYESDP